MGKKGWFSAAKKAVSPSFSKVKRSCKSKSNHKKSCHGNQVRLDTCSSQKEAALANLPIHYPTKEEIEKLKHPENEQIKQVDSVSYVQEESEDVVSNAAAEVNCVTSKPRFPGKSGQEIGAIMIQTAYRGYLARKAFRSMRAKRRLNLLMQGLAVKRQTASTLMNIQTMSRVQSQVRARRIKMAEVNEALQRQLLQRREKELENLRSATFDLSPRSKEQVDAMLKNKKEAAERREKALAYAYARQQSWRKSLKSANPTFMDPDNPDWGWNWTERWNAVRPWEASTTSNREPVGNIAKHVSRQSPPSTPPSKASSVLSQRSKSTKSMNAGSRTSNPRPSPLGNGKKGGQNTGSGVGSTKKRHLALVSTSSCSKRPLGASKKISNTVR